MKRSVFIVFVVISISCATRCQADEPGVLFPVSGPTTMTDEELKREFLRHTHPHVHKDLEDRVGRLEERMNDLVEALNKLMRIVIDDAKKLNMLFFKLGIPRPISARPSTATTSTEGETNEPPRR